MASLLSGQGVKFANTFSGKSTVYGITDSTVFKLDANGNSIWVKDFSGQIAPSNFNNRLISLSFDEEKLILLEMQGEITVGPPPTYNPAVIRMDTLGNVLSTFTSSVQPGGGYNMREIYPSYDNGAWILDNYAPGFTQHSSCFHIDSVGQIGAQVDFWYGSVSYTNKFIYMPDSTYLVSVSHRPSSPGNSATFPALTKFDRSGNIIWRWDYTMHGSTVDDFLTAEDMTVDSLGNIYMFCDYTTSTLNLVVGIKLDSSGNVLIAKAWPDLQPGLINSLTFQNNEVLCIWDNKVVHISTSLFCPCMNNIDATIDRSNNILQSSITHQYSFDTFSPAIGNAFVFVPDSLIDFCTSTSTRDFDQQTGYFILYPNPAGNYLNVALNTPDNILVEIFNLNGKPCLKTKFNSDQKIDVSSLSPGLYIVRLKSDELNIVKRFLVE